MNENHQTKQKWLKFSIVAVVGTVFLIFSYLTISDYLSEKDRNKRTYTSSSNLPMDGVDPKEIWVDQIRTENEVVQEKVDFIQEMLVKLVKEEEEKKEIAHNEITILRSEIDNLRAEIKNKPQIPVSSEQLRSELRNATMNYQNASVDPFASYMPQEQLQDAFVPLTSVVCPEPENLHHIDRTIPAGTTVKAILLSSVDLPCGVKGNADPLPVKLRIIADGRLPHKVRARLKGGIITACVYGDLSSERGFFRLEKLTQVRTDGHYIETQVAGYVSGEDGKYGVRGVVVDKSAQLIENALISGFLSGASNFFETAALAKLYPVYSTETNPMSWKQTAGQLAVAGGSQGTTNALDALTEYFIGRAEQLRPIIQITPGRIVDITFSECADLGDLHTHQRVRNLGASGE